MKFGTITHSAEGIRVDVGSGVTRTFANAIYLAEALAHANYNGHIESKRKALLCEELDRLKRLAMHPNSDLTPITVIESITQILSDDVE